MDWKTQDEKVWSHRQENQLILYLFQQILEAWIERDVNCEESKGQGKKDKIAG